MKHPTQSEAQDAKADHAAFDRAPFWVVEGSVQGEDAKLQRARMRDFARASSDWFWEMDDASRLTMVSERLMAALGRPVSPFIGRPVEELGHFEANLAGEWPMREAIGRRLPFRDQMLRAPDLEGEDRIFHISGVPVFDEHGRYAGYRGAGIDVTEVYRAKAAAEGAHARLGETLAELGRARLELSRAATRAEHSEHSKTQFLSVINHELRTPLNAIIGFAEAMQMQLFGDLGDRYQGYCRDILDASRHLLGLIEDILDVSDFADGTTAVVLEDVKLVDVVMEARALVEARATAKRIDLSAVRAEAGWRLRADRRRLKQILVNLLGNAVKFTPIGGKVGVDVAQAGGDLIATVWDTGIGIAPEQQERVFGQFAQLGGDAFARSHEGTGLGLHISRQLARAMGGDISLESAPGEGSRFHLRLPAAK
ncbi:MAG: hypothetical protein Tsb0016_04700 [Sphingomonadales bacterium]